MRIISQNGMIDLPYELVGVGINYINNKEIIAYTTGNFYPSDNCWIMGKYSTDEKANKVMEILRDSYASSEMYKIMSVNQRAIVLMDTPKGKEETLCGVFVFPQDNEVEETEK